MGLLGKYLAYLLANLRRRYATRCYSARRIVRIDAWYHITAENQAVRSME